MESPSPLYQELTEPELAAVLTACLGRPLSFTCEPLRGGMFNTACGRSIVARGGNPDGSPSHSPSLRYTSVTVSSRRKSISGGWFIIDSIFMCA